MGTTGTWVHGPEGREWEKVNQTTDSGWLTVDSRHSKQPGPISLEAGATMSNRIQYSTVRRTARGILLQLCVVCPVPLAWMPTFPLPPPSLTDASLCHAKVRSMPVPVP